MDKWEYLIIQQTHPIAGGGIYFIKPGGVKKKYSGRDSDARAFHKLLNFYGDLGFELVESATASNNVGNYQTFWVMKRMKTSE